MRNQVLKFENFCSVVDPTNIALSFGLIITGYLFYVFGIEHEIDSNSKT